MLSKMVLDFRDALISLEEFGLTDVLLPFILIFTIVFAVLQKSRILGEGRKNFNVIVALVIALTVVIPHVTNDYPPDRDVVEIINESLPSVSIVIVAIIMVLVLIGVLGGETRWAGGLFGGVIAIIAFLTVGAIFANSAGWLSVPSWLEDPDTQALIVIIVVFGLIIWFITRESSTERRLGFFRKLFEEIGNWWKK